MNAVIVVTVRRLLRFVTVAVLRFKLLILLNVTDVTVQAGAYTREHNRALPYDEKLSPMWARITP